MQLRSPDLSADMGVLSELFASTFGDYAGMHRYAHEGYFDSPPYDTAASKVGWEGETLVTHFGFWRLELRVGSVPLTVAGVGAVATHRDHRKRGLMAQTASAAIDSLIDHGYDVSLLFGIDDYYHAYGYATAFPSYRYELRLAALPEAVPTGLIRWAPDAADIPWREMDALYNRDHADVTVTAVRPTYRRNRMPHLWTPWTWTNKDGSLHGYVIVELSAAGDELLVVDAAGPPAEICGAVRHIATAAVRPSVVFVRTPPRSALGRYLRGSDCTLTAQYRRNGGAMMRIVSLYTVLEKIAPVLAQRLSSGPAAGYHGAFRISVEDEAVDLRIAGGEVEAMRPRGTSSAMLSTDHRFTRLLFGCGPPEENCVGMELGGDAALLVPVLFPDQQPSLTQWDHF